jgi:hypothetical protein
MLLDLATRQDVVALQSTLDQVLGLLSRAQATVADEFMTLEQVAAYVRFDKRVVEKWVREGQFNEGGKKIYLPAHKYSGRLRFKRADVEAFGLGVGVLVPSLAGTPEAAKPAADGKRPRKNASVASEQALRKVA